MFYFAFCMKFKLWISISRVCESYIILPSTQQASSTANKWICYSPTIQSLYQDCKLGMKLSFTLRWWLGEFHIWEFYVVRYDSFILSAGETRTGETYCCSSCWICWRRFTLISLRLTFVFCFPALVITLQKMGMHLWKTLALCESMECSSHRTLE